MDEEASFEPQAVLTRRRAGWNRALVLVPLLAFAVVGWLGLSGQRPGVGLAAGDPSAPRASGEPSGSPVLNIAPDPAIAIPLWPNHVLGLEVRGLRGLDVTALVGEGEIALAGWYEAGSTTGCPPGSDLAGPALVTEMGIADWEAFCQRSGRLFATSPRASTSGTYRLENRFKNDDLPALGVMVRPGVALPPTLVDPGADAAPLVFVGQLVWPFDGCAKFVTRCRPNLLVDRLIWTAGLGSGEVTTLEPSVLAIGSLLGTQDRARLTEAAIGRTGSLLLETLVDMPTLTLVDPEAGAAVAALRPKVQAIWYRRLLAADPGIDAPRWVAIDEATNEALASGGS